MTLFSHLPMDHNEVLRCQIVAKRKKKVRCFSVELQCTLETPRVPPMFFRAFI